MQNKNKYIQQIIKNLQTLNPYMIILFGSYAYGKPHIDSDIDLIVVTNDDFMPTSYKEKTNLYLSINSKIRKIAQEVPIDLLVYTKPMYKKFVELKSSFSREILKKGVILYENTNYTKQLKPTSITGTGGFIGKSIANRKRKNIYAYRKYRYKSVKTYF